ncbi:hypothetical protein HG537_0C06290 [Torulaspora globosa]|uniref:Uncharacterized protein n=1 Tax=Torulaspora globosa TaxID=48254 RepID=A0A7H9HRJ7_9SACH|nr:hypothetical protein HG537_0C06290 [Torulaspora sp. CBS 2947]
MAYKVGSIELIKLVYLDHLEFFNKRSLMTTYLTRLTIKMTIKMTTSLTINCEPISWDMDGLERSMSSEELVQAYVESLESHIHLKRDLLKQVQNATDEVPEAIEPKGDWKELLSKPLFRPDRSDPIGLSLASVSQTTRLESTKKWINEKEKRLVELEQMIRDQKDLNNDLVVLIDLLNRKLETMAITSEKQRPRMPEEVNRQLLSSLEEFVKKILSVDMVDAEHAGDDLSEEVFALIMRLLNHDETLEVADFHKCSKKLFRLLLRSNLITVTDSPNNVRHVKLLDFASYDLS